MDIYELSPNLHIQSIEIAMSFVEGVPHIILAYVKEDGKKGCFVCGGKTIVEGALIPLLNAKLMELDGRHGVPGIVTDPPVSLSEIQDEDDIPF